MQRPKAFREVPDTCWTLIIINVSCYHYSPRIIHIFHVTKFFLHHDFNGCMKLYSMGILNLVIPLLLNIFSIFVSSVLYVALKILIDRFCVCVCVVQFIWVSGLFPISGIMKWEELNNFQGY